VSTGRARAFPAGAALRQWRGRVAERKHSHAGILPVAALVLAVLFSYLAGDWIAGVAAVLLWIIWATLSEKDEPPVLPLALSFQWLQVTCGIYYFALTGREVATMYSSDYRTMVLLGLGCIAALTLGLAVGLRWARFRRDTTAKSLAVPWRTLFLGYLFATFLNAFIRELAWSVPGLAQGLIAIGYLRLAILFLVFRRLIRPRLRWEWFLGILAVEVVLGFTGYFAGFREPLILASLALLEAFDVRSAAQWMRMTALAVLMIAAGVVWMGIRTSYRAEVGAELSQSRAERLERVGTLSSEWLVSELDSMTEDVDDLVERLWAIYYPALAVSRVPEVLPHENGAILLAALTHLVTPRVLFPEKGILASDSEMVRKYSGIFVAGSDENTSIAFGYAAESYVDFGIPLMFVPAFVFGVVMGLIYRAVFRVLRHRELVIGFACVFFWLSLYLYERSWVKTLGTTGTLLIYLGGVVWLLDWKLTRQGWHRARPSRM
jgi:hypothetical protein